MADLDLLLDGDPCSVAPARAAFRRFALPRLTACDVEGAALVISELVTNAQRVAVDAQVRLIVRLSGDVLRIEVTDPDGGPVVFPCDLDPDAENGRGLFLVAALSHRWGTTRHLLGKCVWAEMQVHLLAAA